MRCRMTRNYSLDYFKFFSICGVVIIHSIPFNSEFGFVMNSFSRFAVPFFFIAAGYLFSKNLSESTSKEMYLKKYLLKLIKIYFYWLSIYMFYDIMIMSSKEDLTLVKLLDYLKNNLIGIIYYGGSYSGYHLWFLPALVWSILFVYIFHRVNKTTVICIISILLHLSALSVNIPFYTRDAIFFGLFYTLMGFLAAQKESYIKYYFSKLPKKLCLFMFILFTILQVVEAFFIGIREFYFSTILAMFFLIVLIVKKQNIGKDTSLVKIGSDSLGVFVIHVLVLNFYKFFLSGVEVMFVFKSPVLSTIFTIFIFITSYFLYKFLQSLKKLIKEFWIQCKNKTYYNI